MSIDEAEIYFKKLKPNQRQQFNLLVRVGLKLGKPFEGAYEYAKTIIEQPTKKETK